MMARIPQVFLSKPDRLRLRLTAARSGGLTRPDYLEDDSTASNGRYPDRYREGAAEVGKFPGFERIRETGQH